MRFPQVCLVHLYTIQGAIDNLDFNLLSKETKEDLKAFSDHLNVMSELKEKV